MLRIFLMGLLSTFLIACAATKNIETISHLQQGKRFYNSGLYKRAMHELLPLASDGNVDAQYAVGYMYYYGYGVAKDSDTGYFWIKRAADKHYLPAVRALMMIHKSL